ncbi:MAG: thiamine pyrophosphate-dependent enzyme, partial [Candidatus Woesearchaeota archaeon]
MSWIELIRQERMPTVWCPGCGLGILLTQVAKAFEELGLDYTNTAVVSGIGCTGRFAGYLNMDTVHSLHGRAIPLAEGIKRANENLNVFVISGDGDLTGIGGNHLLHASRRNVNITVICVDNGIYGMTGGQLAPTTEKGMATATSPYGSPYEPINLQGII